MALCRWSVAVLLLAFLWLARPASAHAALIDAEPAPGEQVSRPEEVHLTFNEALLPDSTLSVYGEGFQEVTGVETQVDPEDPQRLVASLPPLEPGLYTVHWLAISTDGHPVSGSYSFSVREQRRVLSARSAWWLAAVAGALMIALVVGGIWWQFGRSGSNISRSVSHRNRHSIVIFSC